MANKHGVSVTPEFKRTVDLLGGGQVLQHPIQNRIDVHDLIVKGMPGQALDHLVGHVAIFRYGGIAKLEKAVGISPRTYQRRKAAPQKALSPEQSGRAWKFAEVLARATELMGSQLEAERWLEQPAIALDRRRPVDLLSTPAGVSTLEDHLTRLEYGVYT